MNNGNCNGNNINYMNNIKSYMDSSVLDSIELKEKKKQQFQQKLDDLNELE